MKRREVTEKALACVDVGEDLLDTSGGSRRLVRMGLRDTRGQRIDTEAIRRRWRGEES